MVSPSSASIVATKKVACIVGIVWVHGATSQGNGTESETKQHMRFNAAGQPQKKVHQIEIHCQRCSIHLHCGALQWKNQQWCQQLVWCVATENHGLLCTATCRAVFNTAALCNCFNNSTPRLAVYRHLSCVFNTAALCNCFNNKQHTVTTTNQSAESVPTVHVNTKGSQLTSCPTRTRTFVPGTPHVGPTNPLVVLDAARAVACAKYVRSISESWAVVEPPSMLSNVNTMVPKMVSPHAVYKVVEVVLVTLVDVVLVMLTVLVVELVDAVDGVVVGVDVGVVIPQPANVPSLKALTARSNHTTPSWHPSLKATPVKWRHTVTSYVCPAATIRRVSIVLEEPHCKVPCKVPKLQTSWHGRYM
jgi:hypothetical protein